MRVFANLNSGEMNYENDKRMDVEIDRLSSLPDDLIHKILSFNNTIDAIGTSSLSSRWRYIWTTMPCLDFSSEDFTTLPKFSKFVRHVLSGRDNQREVSSVRLRFRGKVSQVFVRKTLNYAISHSVQQLTVTCLAEKHFDFPLSLFSSQSLKHLTLKLDYCEGRYGWGGSISITSMWELPALTTLQLDDIILSHDMTNKFSDVISKCVNLKNLTLRSCRMRGMKLIEFNICHSQLSNLTVHHLPWDVISFSVVAPKLKNLSIRGLRKGIMISAPNLANLLFEDCDCSNFSSDKFHSLEKADICITRPWDQDLQKILALLRRLNSVKILKLNLEILELLSSSPEVISHQPSPFANLESVKVYPEVVNKWELPDKIVNMSTEVKNYLLDNSPGATFTIVSREEIIAETNILSAQKLMAELRVLLDEEKAGIETNRAHREQENAPTGTHNAKMDEQKNTQVENHMQNEGNMSHIDSCWEGLSDQIEQGKEKTDDIISMLKEIKKKLTELPASSRDEMQPYFSSLCAEADIVMSKITESMKIQFVENQSRLSVCLHELATTLQSSS